MTDSKQLEKILDKLSEAGFSEAYIRSLLPSWWNDRIADNPAGLSEFNLALSRNLGVELQGLSIDDPKIQFRLPHETKLKRSIRYTSKQLTPATSVALSAARIAVQALRKPYTPLPPATELRQKILDSGVSYVSLRSLLKTCWDHGIPVLHVSNFPDGMPKMDGLAAVVKERPAIVLSKLTRFSAWMSFILAHEMGHVANDHCDDGELIVDESLDEQSYGQDELDEQEKEADNYALSLLSGDYDISDLVRSTKDPESLARSAIAIQRKTGIDGGHIVLKFGYQTKNWQLAIAALKGLDTQERAQSDILTAMGYELDSDLVSSGSLAFLYRVCGIPVFD